MLEDLIYDVGMCDGTDTDFYLKKGFRVVAIEANPGLAAQARERFSDAIASGQLIVLNLAIGETDGRVPFYVSQGDPGWSTVASGFAEGMSNRYGARFEPLETDSRRFESILERHGVPYYLKIDIEAADLLCLSALEQFSERPRYVSIEMPHRHDWEALSQNEYADLCRLFLLGYRGFKIIDQRFHSRIALPQPAREGLYVAHEFRGHTTGPFGEETPGSWRTFDQIVPVYRTALSRMEPAWFDLHAKLDETVPPPHPRRRTVALSSLIRAARRLIPKS